MVRPLALGVVLLVAVSGTGAVASAAATASPAGAPGDASTVSAAGTPSDRSSSTELAVTNRSERRQFDFTVRDVSACGASCRDVTLTVVNTGNETATDVRFVTRLEAGGHVVWRGSESVAKLDPGESTTVTKRVRLGLAETGRVVRNDGYVTANTTVTWDSGRETFSERRRVA